jgi:hypothetical protein
MLYKSYIKQHARVNRTVKNNFEYHFATKRAYINRQHALPSKGDLSIAINVSAGPTYILQNEAQ